MKIIVYITFSTALLLFSVFYSKEIFSELINSSPLAWLVSFVTPVFLATSASIVLAINVVRKLNVKKFKFLISLLIFSIGVSVYLIINKPYIEDYSKTGHDLEVKDNALLADLLSKNSEYSGIVMIASKSCPYCMASAKKLSLLQKRSNKIDVAVYIYSTSLDAISDFSLDSGVTDIDFHLVVDEDSTLDLCEGKFPTFIYVKNSTIVHKWYNKELGMPALDWIESGLN